MMMITCEEFEMRIVGRAAMIVLAYIYPSQPLVNDKLGRIKGNNIPYPYHRSDKLVWKEAI